MERERAARASRKKRAQKLELEIDAEWPWRLEHGDDRIGTTATDWSQGKGEEGASHLGEADDERDGLGDDGEVLHTTKTNGGLGVLRVDDVGEDELEGDAPLHPSRL